MSWRRDGTSYWRPSPGENLAWVVAQARRIGVVDEHLVVMADRLREDGRELVRYGYHHDDVRYFYRYFVGGDFFACATIAVWPRHPSRLPFPSSSARYPVPRLSE